MKVLQFVDVLVLFLGNFRQFDSLVHVYALEIWFSRWLSGSDLKKVALFGCPSLARKSVFGAKRLRRFFEIPEETVSQLSCPISFSLSLIYFTYCINLMFVFLVPFRFVETAP